MVVSRHKTEADGDSDEVVTIAILPVLCSWHDYLWPFLEIKRDSVKALVVDPVGFEVRLTTDYGPLVADSALASLPPLILFTAGAARSHRGTESGTLQA